MFDIHDIQETDEKAMFDIQETDEVQMMCHVEVGFNDAFARSVTLFNTTFFICRVVESCRRKYI